MQGTESLRPTPLPRQSSTRKFSSSALLLFAALAVLLGSMFGPYDLDFPNAGRILMTIAAAACIAAVALARHETDSQTAAASVPNGWAILAALALIHIGIALYTVRTVSPETIDCITFQRDAVKTLLHGVDPYGQTQANIYAPAETRKFYGPGMVIDGRVQVGFQYPPLTLLWSVPGYLLGDIRFSYILAIVIAASTLFAAVPNARSLAVAAFLLLNPLTFYVEDRGWTEPLVLMLMAITLYAATRKSWWLPVALGLLLACKQYNFIAVPFLGYLVLPLRWKAALKLAGWSILVAIATVLPFAVWNLRALFHDIILFHLAQPFRDDALSLAVPFPILLKIGPIFLIAFIAWFLRTAQRQYSTFAAGYAIAMLIFVLTSKQAFCNYFFLAGNVLLLAIAGNPGRVTHVWILRRGLE